MHKDLGTSTGKDLHLGMDVNNMTEQIKATIALRILMHIHTFATCKERPNTMSYQSAVALLGGAFIKFAENGTSEDKNFDKLIKVN